MKTKILLFLLIFVASSSKLKAQTTTADTTVYTEVDKEPRLAGGMLKLIGKKIKYHKNAYENKITGRVELSFVVEKDGTLTNFKVTKSADPELDAEFLRAMKKSPKWIPGEKDGKIVRTLHHESMNFTISGE
ncbi:energy transducer TonB [Mucilaginibacter lutimaris]|uniref:Energy transducer TonB n=1 Tax=Mucilaginibacter lutimaris TaxID=931629 RepID=A0ABW2ZFL1_9SPHI